MKTLSPFIKFLPLVILLNVANVGKLYSYQDGVILCLVSLEYAEADQLADVLAPFLSPQGNIAFYSPTNKLIIKDQPEMVKMLIKVIKGKADLAECQNYPKGSKAEEQIPPD